jgi:hypothetical protein
MIRRRPTTDHHEVRVGSGKGESPGRTKSLPLGLEPHGSRNVSINQYRLSDAALSAIPLLIFATAPSK